MTDSRTYNLEELAIAMCPEDPRRILPPVRENHRSILDIGGGAGQTLIALDLGGRSLVVSVDLDFEALSLGKELSEGIDFVCARGESLPFKDHSFDMVICRVAIPYMHISKALTEMGRVLRPGGLLWATLHTFQMTAGELLRHLVGFEIRGAIYRLYILINGVALHYIGRQFRWPFSQGRYESCQSTKGITRSLHSAGFTEIRIQKNSFFIVTAEKTYNNKLQDGFQPSITRLDQT